MDTGTPGVEGAETGAGTPASMYAAAGGGGGSGGGDGGAEAAAVPLVPTMMNWRIYGPPRRRGKPP